MKNFAFTLAETLIVMGIIGVVAALTLPNLNSSTSNKEKVVKLQKIYQNLNDAYGRAVAVYGPFDEWFINDDTTEKKEKRMFDRITEFMKYSKACTVTECSAVFDKGGTSGGDYSGTAKYNVILADGSTVGFMYDGFYSILVDIDGLNKGPNTAGKDFFTLRINDKNHVTHDIGCSLYNSFVGCIYVSFPDQLSSSHAAEWVLINHNMDYLKLGSDGNCPDGKKLQFGVKTSCK